MKPSQHACRSKVPMGDDEAEALAKHYEMDSIKAAAVKVRKKAMKDSGSSDSFEE